MRGFEAAVSLIVGLLSLVVAGCSTLPAPAQPSPLLKQYKHMILPGHVPGMQDSGVHVDAGDTYTIIATGSVDLAFGSTASWYHDVRPEFGWPLLARVGRTPHFYPLHGRNAATLTAKHSGNLHFAVKDGYLDMYGDTKEPRNYADNRGYFDLHIFVWKSPDYAGIAQFFEAMRVKDPEHRGLLHAAEDARELSRVSHECAKPTLETPHYKLYDGVPIAAVGSLNPTGICIPRRATVAVLAKGVIADSDPTVCPSPPHERLWVRVGKHGIDRRLLIGDSREPANAVVFSATEADLLYFDVRGSARVENETSSLSASVLVWEREHEAQIESDLEQLLSSGLWDQRPAHVWTALAQHFSRVGDHLRAERLLRRLREGLRGRGEMEVLVLVISSMNEFGLGNYEAARAYARRASEIAKERGLGTHRGLALLYEARALSRLGKHREAVGLLEDAISVWERDAYWVRKYWPSYAQLFLGQCKLALDEPDEALRHLESALTRIAEHDRVRLGPELYLCLGEALVRLQRPQEAVNFFHRAIAEAQEIVDVPWRAHSRLGRIHEAMGDDAQALGHYAEAIRIIESMRGKVVDPGLKSLFMEDKHHVYEWMIRLLMRKERCEDAFHYLERSRARVMLEMLGAKALKPRNEHVREKLARERVLRREIELLQGEMGQAGGPGAFSAQAAEELAVLREEHESVMRQIHDMDPELASLIRVSPVSASEIQGLLDSGTVLLEYFLGETVRYVFVVTRDKVAAVPLEAEPEVVFRRLKEFRTRAVDAITLEGILSNAHEGPLSELHEMLIRPVEKEIEGKVNLVIVPHGMLHYLPFQALRDKNGSYLLESFTVSYLPSASVLKYVRSKNKGNRDSVLAVGNPSTDLEPLPAAEHEAREVSRLFDKKLLLTGRQATETSVKHESPGYDMVLLSTHGEMIESEPLKSNLRFAPSDGDDGRLTVGEIFDMEVKANLVTLSACETALVRGAGGDFPQGDDLVGMSRAFIHAGAPSVVASLWKVSDDSTVELMKAFHRNLASMPKAEALRQAQLDLMKRKIAFSVERGGSGITRSAGYQPGLVIECSHPFFWAPFVLVGDWR